MTNLTAEYLKTTQKHYTSLDGLRAISCIGIMLMHILANTRYELSGIVYERIIPSFTHLVILFLMISGFGMCAGYLQKILDNKIDLEAFYKKRYKRLLPYFMFLIVIALIVEPSLHNFFDATMEITLLYGLLPNNALNVIGVCWTIGVIFLFYLLFPAFSVLMKSKKRAWISLGVSLWIAFVCCTWYFSDFYVNELFTPRHSFLFCLPLFISGGIIFLYRENIEKLLSVRYRRMVGIFLTGGGMIMYYILPDKIDSCNILFEKNLILFGLVLAYFVGVESKIMGCRAMKFLGDMSMEIYLSHMFVFRAYERLGILYKFGTGQVGYWLISILVFVGVVALILGYRIFLRLTKKVIAKCNGEKNAT